MSPTGPCRHWLSAARAMHPSAARTGGDASGRWQTALRADVKRSAAVLENARYLYQTEMPLALTVIEARIRQQQLEAAQLGQPADVQQALRIEQSIQAARVGLGSAPCGVQHRSSRLDRGPVRGLGLTRRRVMRSSGSRLRRSSTA